MSDAGYAGSAGESVKKNRGQTIAIIILSILALPVLVPLALGIGGLALGILLALAGGGLAVILGISGCILAGAAGLAVVIFGAVIGIGFGAGMLFSTPASGLAVLGASLFALGAGILIALALWKMGRHLPRAARKAVGWLHELLFAKSGKAGMLPGTSGFNGEAKTPESRTEVCQIPDEGENSHDA